MLWRQLDSDNSGEVSVEEAKSREASGQLCAGAPVLSCSCFPFFLLLAPEKQAALGLGGWGGEIVEYLFIALLQPSTLVLMAP